MLETQTLFLNGTAYCWEYDSTAVRPADRCQWFEKSTAIIPSNSVVQKLKAQFIRDCVPTMIDSLGTEGKQHLFLVLLSMGMSASEVSAKLGIQCPIRCSDCSVTTSDRYDGRCKQCHEAFVRRGRQRNGRRWDGSGMTQ